MTKTIEEIIESMIEVTLPSEENFLKVKETLTRIGVANKNNELFQSCHILQKRGKFYIVHFKELFLLDTKPSTITEEDIGRRNTIVNLLSEWELVKLVKPEKSKEPVVLLEKIKIIPFKEKVNWKLTPKYTIGGSKKKEVA
jgi:hypothetical protein